MTANERLAALRRAMQEAGIDAYLVQSSDDHQSEYLAPHFAERAWLTGFTGSAGVAIITADEALVWADGRYTIQVKRQLEGSDFQPMPWTGAPGTVSPQAWLQAKLKPGETLAYHGAYMSPLLYQSWIEPLTQHGVKIREDLDLVAQIWSERPKMPHSEAFVLDVSYTGESVPDKLERIRQAITAQGATHTAIASLDDIAWLTNLRGRDIENNPVIFAYFLLGPETATLYTELTKIGEAVRRQLREDGIQLKGYQEIYDDLSALPQDSVLFYDPERFNRKLLNAVPKAVALKRGVNPSTNFKALKNDCEARRQKEAYAIDALALTRFMYWLHEKIELAHEPITEYAAAERLLTFRQEAESFIEPSFGTIAAYGPNAAMMHYAPDPEHSPVIEPRGLFLFDSGGQYYEGTTDITRTQQMGELTEEERLAYTYTMKSSLTLLMGRFLAGASGSALDAIARYPLWQIGSDYKCGTGHGVGFCLNVHEGPQRLGFKPNDVALEPGMVVTVEPGVYKEGAFGIRIENVCIVVDDISNDSGLFRRLELLNYIPMDTRPLVKSHLSEAEIDWLNAYQARCLKELKPQLNADEAAWLEEFCQPI